MKNLIARFLKNESGATAIELTAEQLSDPRVTHGHGAENAGETRR